MRSRVQIVLAIGTALILIGAACYHVSDYQQSKRTDTPTYASSAATH